VVVMVVEMVTAMLVGASRHQLVVAADAFSGGIVLVGGIAVVVDVVVVVASAVVWSAAAVVGVGVVVVSQNVVGIPGNVSWLHLGPQHQCHA
jgi:hypothetical protein